MAAGKHGGYRTNELKFRESVLDFNRKDHYYSSKQDDEYRRYRPDDRVLNRHREFECRKDRYGRDSVTSSRRDTREKEEKNHDYYSSSSRGNSGRKLSSRTKEREPADLAIGWDKETLKLKMEVQMPPTKKQKVSPVECDREVKKQQLQSHVGKEEGRVSNFLSKSLSISPGVCDPQSSPYSANELPGLFGLDLGLSSSGSSCLTHQERYGGSDQEMGQLEPTRNIAASRWADEDEGEIIDVDDVVVASHSTKVETPELGELSKEVRPHDESECPVNEEKEEVDEEDLNGNETTDCLGDFQEENDSAPTQRSFNMLQGCRSVFEFERIGKISEGTYGVVYKAIDKKTGDIVALKKWKEKEEETEGFPITAMREINILISSHHPSIVDVKEVVMGNKDDVYMVMEYMEHDLKKVIETMEHPFSLSEAKCLMLQLLKGVKYLHDNWILHRDLKSSNILLNDKGELKICDFGMSRQYGSPLKPYTALVVTLWYRAPELLLGAKQYSTAIDMWSLGCIMAELVAKKPLFSGTSELDQLHKIFRVLGTPSEETWPGFSKLPGIKVNFVKQPYNLLHKIFPSTSFTGSPCLTDAGVDLLNRLLTYDPEKRMTAEEAINHEWFCEFPLPKSKDSMPKFALPKSKNLKPTIPQDPRYRILSSPEPLEDQGGINNGNCSLILVIFFG